MKKILALTLAVLMILGLLAGCSSSDAGSAGVSANYYGLNTVTDGKLTVAVSPDFAPMGFVDATKEGQDRFVGFDILLAKYLAEEMGLELVISPMNFDACQTAVSLGVVDMSLCGFSWSETREENYNLSDYYQAGDDENQTLITMAQNAGKYTTAESLAGLKVGAQTASLQEDLCKSQLADCELVIVADMTTALMQLRNGDFDVLAVAEGHADSILVSNKDLAKAGFYFEVDPRYTGNVIMMRKGNDALTDVVNQLLAQAKAAGYYLTWYDESRSIAGVEVIYDENGNIISESEVEAEIEIEEAASGLDFGTIAANVSKLWSEYWQVFLIEGLTCTIQLTCIAVILGVLLGAVVAMLKMSKFKVVRFLISIYIEVIRGTPALLQLYIFVFALPTLLPLKLSYFTWTAIALSINSSAYVSEVIRSGIQSIDKGQTEAARSLGLSNSQTMMRIVLPQAVRNILPALGNEFIMILKETSLASTFFVGDLMTSYLTVKGATYLGFECLLIVGMIYLCVTFPLSKVVGYFEKKMASPNSYRKRAKKEAQ